MQRSNLAAFFGFILFVGCNGGGGGPGARSSGGAQIVEREIIMVDPYIEGATMCWDKNESGNCDDNEPESSVSSSKGVIRFSSAITGHPNGLPPGVKLVQKLKGVSLGKPFLGNLKTSSDLPIATPITTLIMNAGGDEDAKELVLAKLNASLGAAGIELSEEDILKNPMEGVEGKSNDLKLIVNTMAVNAALIKNPNLALSNEPANLVSLPSDVLETAKVLKDVIKPEVINALLDPEKILKTAIVIQEFVATRPINASFSSNDFDETKINTIVNTVSS